MRTKIYQINSKRDVNHVKFDGLDLMLPATATLCYGFLTIRMDDTTILDFIRYAGRYFITTQQYYEWR